MDLSRATDAELLALWLGAREERAFQSLVGRYAGLVHAAARRTCVNNPDLAAEVSQLVFIQLARKAPSLSSHTSLAAWLHVTTVMQARNLLRKTWSEDRKRRQLQSAMETDFPDDSSRGVWQEMQPVLDDALAALAEKDREALLLRFYRSLSIREVGQILGIATDAAQKRVDRAMARLRDKLARRGCTVAGSAGSLAIILATGLAVDAKAATAAISVTSLGAQALATVTVAPAPASFWLTLSTMKTTTCIIPAVALLAAGLWIGSNRMAIASLEKRNDDLAARITRHGGPSNAATVSSSIRSEASVRSGQGGAAEAGFQGSGPGGIDWLELARFIDEARASGRNYEMDPDFMLADAKVNKLSKEELLAAIRHVASLDLPKAGIDELEDLIGHPLCRRFSRYALENLTERLDAGSGPSLQACLSDAFRNWLRDEPSSAMQWLDQRIDEGSFESRTLDGRNWLRNSCEGAVINHLLSKDPEAAARRLDSLPSDQRSGINFAGVRKEDQVALVELIRSRLKPEDALETISTQVCSLDHPRTVDEFLDRIHATPEETRRCVERAAETIVVVPLLNHRDTPADFDRMREWVETRLPGAADRITGETLGSRIVLMKLGFQEAAAMAGQYAAAGGGDAVWVPFLESDGVQAYREQVRALVSNIADPAARGRILDKLK